MHILGFHGNLMPYWFDSTGSPYTSMIYTQTCRGHPTEFLTTPNVKAAAQLHYGCSTLEGMPLENQESNVRKHWEKLMVGHDLMVAKKTSEFSKFS
jgi:hypothetical protein